MFQSTIPSISLPLLRQISATVCCDFRGVIFHNITESNGLICCIIYAAVRRILSPLSFSKRSLASVSFSKLPCMPQCGYDLDILELALSRDWLKLLGGFVG